MTPRLSLLLLPLLAACAAGPPRASAPGPAMPRAVTLYRDTVTARMPDGTLCAAVRGTGSGPWSTAFAGCPHPWPVRVLRPPARPRLALSPAAEAPWVTLEPPGGLLGYAPGPAAPLRTK